MLGLLIAAAVFAGGPPAADGLPTVPGAVNSQVTQANIKTTVCVPNWTKSIRPPSSYTDKIKFALMDKAGIPRSLSDQYELDHDISLEIGGNPKDPKNLWLQPYFGSRNAHYKDRVEDLLHQLVCSGIMSLSEAQREISSDWVSVFRQRIGPLN